MYQLVFLILVSTFVFTFGEETTCETHRSNSQAQGAAVTWDIQCDENGKYKPLQCTHQTPQWCACYDEEGKVKGPSMKLRHCDCPLARHRAEQENAPTCDIPECERTGLYKKTQCCAQTRECHCVDENTGESTSQPSSDPNLQC